MVGKEGIMSLYKGAGIVVAAAAPAQAMYFGGYEAVRAVLGNDASAIFLAGDTPYTSPCTLCAHPYSYSYSYLYSYSYSSHTLTNTRTHTHTHMHTHMAPHFARHGSPAVRKRHVGAHGRHQRAPSGNMCYMCSCA